MELKPDDLFALANQKMPFGKFEGRPLIDLPEPYVLWLSNQGPIKGRFKELIEQLCAIKVNGLEHLIQPLKGKSPPRQQS
ncbi:DUF3820 family protein [Pseudobacteriovorax antillogorgiicola]|uniref:DUF3820 family protein n=1 Tax=Pseudobacteriovorax antillogorgiicola TaxID=1513793 RepID=A0A1Y6BIB9_9BACT|nr:DUF3820 family protein [Pseudobacteriovorax antillogorgiicola]TCS57314.1 hypothetical protein EDD56_10354 [Pseudobacteriovorax antillogorgiicola]SMF02627.1 hypothetical protein SAMN06296036_103279 [Pseudobacteriovorax antillogorgiicola]